MSEPESDFAKLAALAQRSGSEPVWLRVGRVIDGTSSAVTRDVDVVFDAHQIHLVGTNPVAAGKSVPDLVLQDYTALPCLIEAHAHAFLEGAPIDPAVRAEGLKGSAETMLAAARARWPKILQCGIGAVRDAGDKFGVGLALGSERKRTMGGLATTPWIDSPGAAIYHRGRYGAFMGEPIEDHAGPTQCVAARVREGADRIKLLVSGIINFKVGQVTTPPQMSAAEVATLVGAARECGRQTFAHASGADGIENSIEGGVNTVEHGFFITDDQLAKMRDREIGWVPTFAPVQLQIDRAAELGWDQIVVGHLNRIIDSHQKMLCKAQQRGVKIVAGSDAGSCGVPHGVGFLDELCHMERAGLSTMEVLRSATGVSAAVLGFPEPIGRLAAGFRSRFILTRHDPLQSVVHLRKEKLVIFDGVALASPGEISLDGL